MSPPDVLSLSDIFTLIAGSEDLLKWDVGHGPTQSQLLGIVSSQFSSDGVRKLDIVSSVYFTVE